MARLFRIRNRPPGSVRCAISWGRRQDPGIEYGRVAGAFQGQRIILCDAREPVDGGADSYAAELRRGFHQAAFSDGFSERGFLGSHVRRQPGRPAFRRTHRGPQQINIHHPANKLARGCEEMTSAPGHSHSIWIPGRRRMKIQRIALAVWLTAASAVLASACFAQDNPARTEQVVQSYVANKTFMGSVLVVRDKAVLLEKGYGSADLEWDIPNSPTTKFRLGSITKQFTAASILLLEERGKLNIDDPVKKYMPDAPSAWDKITIYNLLTHTSGIPSFTSFPDYESTEATSTTPKELVARFRDKPLNFQPGEKWEYSNSGYVLLGYLLEKVSGQSYKDCLQENIFKPLGMNDSGYDSNTAIIMHRASGYVLSPTG